MVEAALSVQLQYCILLIFAPGLSRAMSTSCCQTWLSRVQATYSGRVPFGHEQRRQTKGRSSLSLITGLKLWCDGELQWMVLNCSQDAQKLRLAGITLKTQQRGHCAGGQSKQVEMP